MLNLSFNINNLQLLFAHLEVPMPIKAKTAIPFPPFLIGKRDNI